MAWEPAFAQDLEWTFLHALRQLGRPDGTSAYFRLSTFAIDQALANVPSDITQRSDRRRLVVAGGYCLRRAARTPDITLVGAGVVMSQVVSAAISLANLGVEADVICLTSPDLIFRAHQARRGLCVAEDAILDELFPAMRSAPMVTVLDGHPHTLSFLGNLNCTPMTCLGVSDFGQAGDVGDLYAHFGIDADTIVGAAFDLLDG